MKLPCHEWSIVLLFCSILCVLSIYAYKGEKNLPLPQISASKAAYLQVKVEGEVARPGVYQLALKSTMKDLLAQAEPLPSADLSQLNWRKQLRDGQTIKVPERGWITIQITGMVLEPGPLKIKSGTRIQEVVEELKVLPDADLKRLIKRRGFLFEGDVLDIPAKKSKAIKKKL